MSDDFVILNEENLHKEHLCCAISDKKHQCGVDNKKKWLEDRIPEGHVFRKLDQKGKVFIEYSPLETAWVPIEGDNYLFIYCLWVSGSFKGKGHAASLIDHCINDAKEKKRSGICVISSNKKKPFLSEKKFFQKYGFETVDTIDDYELLALSFDGSVPKFSESAHSGVNGKDGLTVYYSPQCPYIMDCLMQIENYCKENSIVLEKVKIDSAEKARTVPYVFNNWVTFYNGKFLTTQLMNENSLKKMLKG